MVGQSQCSVPQPKGLDGEDPEEAGVSVIGRRSGHHAAKRRKYGSLAGATMSARHPEQKGRAWIEKKKVKLQLYPLCVTQYRPMCFCLGRADLVPLPLWLQRAGKHAPQRL